ncbi:tetratricopeptide repeat protein 28-like [Dendronephthya gigantea]|uniref:tetratricopeptide repeat protein 28-like n=1 Tax=Dendronephthya gigantea TaxID=151771 RepID=UPI001068EF11|nr:tetratricopeptide repeat protein 28-like [Dendronephthya gigantea]
MPKKFGFKKANSGRQAPGSSDRFDNEASSTAENEHDRNLTEWTRGEARGSDRRRDSNLGLTPQACVSNANELRISGEYKDAIRFYIKALKILTQSQTNTSCRTEALIGLGHTYRDVGKKEKAISCFEEAMPLARSGSSRKQLSEVLLGFAKVYENNKEYEQAIEKYKRARETAIKHDFWPAKDEACLALERIFKQIGDYETAKQYLSEVSNTCRSSFKRKPGSREKGPRDFLDLGDRCKRYGEFQRAIAAYEKAVKSAQRDQNEFKTIAYQKIGYCYKKLNEIDKARKYFEKGEKTAEEQWEILPAVMKVMNTFTLSDHDFGAGDHWLETFYPQNAISSIDGE